MKNFSALEKEIGFKFKNIDLLLQATVHRSYLNEHADFKLHHNERLEFLGDAVLEIIVTEYLFLNYPETPEGDLTNWRASLVNTKMLSLVATELKLDKYMHLSKGEAKDSNSKARGYILANAVEAIIGAIYLDSGIKQATKFVNKRMISKLDNILDKELYRDPKSKFQEKAQEKFKATPYYKVLKEEGPDHDKIFEIGLYLSEKLIAKGSGKSKQEAQVDAARNGIQKKKW